MATDDEGDLIGGPHRGSSLLGVGYGTKRNLDSVDASLKKVLNTVAQLGQVIDQHFSGRAGGTQVFRTPGGGTSVMTNTGLILPRGLAATMGGAPVSPGGPAASPGGPFSRFFGGAGGNNQLANLFALQMGAQALGNVGMRIGSSFSGPAAVGTQFQFAANRIARFSGQPMSTSALRGMVSGYTSPEDAMAGTHLLLNTMYRPNQGQFNGAFRGASGIGTLTGMGFAQSAGILAQMGSAQVVNRMQMFGGAGLTDRQGNIRSTSTAFQQMLKLAITGNPNSNISANELRRRGTTSMNLYSGNAARNLRGMGLGDDTIQAMNEFLKTKGPGGGFVDLDMVGADSAAGRSYRRKYGIQTSSQIFNETQQARTERQSQTFDKTRGSMETLEQTLQKLNRTMSNTPADMLNLGFVFGKLAQASVGLLQAFVTARMITGAMGASTGIGAGALYQQGLGAIGLGGGQLALMGLRGVGLRAGVGGLAGYVGGKVAGAAGVKSRWGRALAGGAVGAGAGGLLGAGVFSLPGAAIGGAAGFLGGLMGDPPGGGSGTPSGASGLDTDFAKKLAQMMAENPRLRINSGFRTYDQQRTLYERYLRGEGPVAAAPGHSQHERGLAADLGPASEYSWLASNAGRFGLQRTVSSEPWHFEPIGARTQGSTAEARAAEDGGAPGGMGATSALAVMYLGDKYGSVNAASVLSQTFARGPSKSAPGRSGGGMYAASSGGAGGGDLRSILMSAGFSGAGLELAYKHAMAESGGRAGATNINKDRWHSRDRGPFQINDHWHPEVTDAQAYDPYQSAVAAYRISNGGTDWSQWRAPIGDPAMGRAGGGMSVHAPKTVHIANVTIKIDAQGSSPAEARRLAKEIAAYLSDADTVNSIAVEA